MGHQLEAVYKTRFVNARIEDTKPYYWSKDRIKIKPMHVVAVSMKRCVLGF